jgi:hypothetical protein
VVYAKVLLDSADALQEVIDFFREARDVLGSDFKCVDPKTGLNVCKPSRISTRSAPQTSFVAICRE